LNIATLLGRADRRAQLEDASAEVLRLVSRGLDRPAVALPSTSVRRAWSTAE
jgi:hypothetical protein